jgi:superfamily II DNA or RNA helicase
MSMLVQVRDTASEAAWVRGVRLARQGAVHGLSSTHDPDGEVLLLQVNDPDGGSAHEVTLHTGDTDWGCTCPDGHDVCAHVVAAVIALTEVRKRQGGRALPKGGDRPAPPPGGPPPPPPTAAPRTVGYRLKRSERGLIVDRAQVHLDEDEPLVLPLVGRKTGPTLVTTEADLALDELFRNRWGSVPPAELMPRLLLHLAQCKDVTLDGKKLPVSADLVLPHGLVDDDPDPRNPQGFRVRLVRDPGITEALGGGAVLVKGTLRPVGKGDLTVAQRQALTKGIPYNVDDVQALVAEHIPHLRQRIPVLIRTTRLPDGLESKPRLRLETEARGETLIVKPVIIYGDPPTARIEREELEIIGNIVPIRNPAAERRLRQESSDHLGLPVGLERTLSGEAAVRFVDQLVEFPGDLHGDGWRRFRRAAALTPQVHIDGDRLDLDFGGADPQRLVDAWLAGERMVRVAEGWAPLPTGWLEQHGHLVADLLAARDAQGRVPRHALFDLARLAKDLDQPPPPQLDGLRALVDGFSGLPRGALPADLRAELRAYQQTGVDWLRFLQIAGMGGILADDMGLGKTLQTLCVIDPPALVVCPTSVLHNWEAEARKFRPGLKVHVYHGPTRVLGDPTGSVVLTTYGILRGDIDALSKIRWKVAVLDEAQAIKNPDSQVARAAYKLEADLRLTLTGTPVENRLEELWSQLHFANRGLLGGRRDFRERYEKPISLGEPGVAARLRERIAPFVLRRMKEQVAPELPPRTDMTLYCTLSTKERAVYDAVRAATREQIARELGKGASVLAALEALLRLRQAACHVGLVPGTDEPPTSSKLELLLETLEEVIAEGHKALVFSQWTSLLDRVEPVLKGAKVPFVRLDGSTRDRAEVVDRFQSAEGPPVFLISLRAGGTGLNLTNADHVFLLDPWWNPAVEDQAADRAHRLGQDKPVMVYRLVSEDTVEERILSLQERKRALADAALGEADRAGSITRDELLALLD